MRRTGLVLAVATASLVAVVLIGAVVIVAERSRREHPFGEIDGILWRQVAGSFDPVKSAAFSQEHVGGELLLTPGQYVDALPGARWDGDDGSAGSLGLEEGAAVIYDVAETAAAASFSVFVSSGPRADAPTDDGQPYSGPSTVYTCVRVETLWESAHAPTVVFDPDDLTCPAALVARLPADARYADPHAFDG